jgi:hypothetical protein
VEIKLDELMTLQSALVNLKMFLSQERKITPDELVPLVDEAYRLVMKKIDDPQQPFYL